jgi:hypothetical protein
MLKLNEKENLLEKFENMNKNNHSLNGIFILLIERGK